MKKMCAALAAALLLAGLLTGCAASAPPPDSQPDSVSQPAPVQDETPSDSLPDSDAPQSETPPEGAPANTPANGPRVADGCFTFTPQQLADLLNDGLPDEYLAGGGDMEGQYVLAVVQEDLGDGVGIILLYEDSDTPVTDGDSTAVNGLAFAFTADAVESNGGAIAAVDALIMACDPTLDESDAMTIFYSLLSAYDPEESPIVHMEENGLRYIFSVMDGGLFTLMIQPA